VEIKYFLVENRIKLQKEIEAVLDAARKYNCQMTEIRSLTEYPEIIDW
jgi:hypothetical protein